MPVRSLSLFLVILACAPGAVSLPAKNTELVIYTSRTEHLLKPILDRYTAARGVKFKYLTAKAPAIVQKLIAEGKNTRADLLITVDAGNLWLATQKNLLASLQSKTLATKVPAHLRDSNMRWVGLSLRARTIVYNATKVKPAELSSYEGLATTKWYKRLCLRTSQKVYNRSLVAMLVAIHGAKKTEEVLKGWVKNLATPVFSSDTKVIEAVKSGQCAVGVVNTYYLGRLQKKDPGYPVKIFWPNQDSHGVHVNISGAGIVRHSKNYKTAIAFLEWLAQGEAQRIFAESNLEYPIDAKVARHKIVAGWGSFKASNVSLSRISKLQPEAIKVMDRAGYL